MEAEGTKEPDCRLRMFADDGVICVESRLQGEEVEVERWRCALEKRTITGDLSSVASVNQK